MTHRLEWISADWMHELTLEQFEPTSAASGFRLFPKLTSASNPTDPRNKPVRHLFYRMGTKNLKKR